MRNGQRYGEQGGITILVALMMLVFITLTAVGMSRNSFREVVISGTTRQGAMARNVADSGIEWSIYWLDSTNTVNASGNSAKLYALKTQLLQTTNLAGRAWNVTSSSVASPTLYAPATATAAATLPTITTAAGTTMTQQYTAGLTNMGKMPSTDSSQGIGSGAFVLVMGENSKLLPDLWAVRTDAKVTVGSVTFIHAKELWLSTPVAQ